LHDNTKSVTGMNTILNLHRANKALAEVDNLYKPFIHQELVVHTHTQKNTQKQT